MNPSDIQRFLSKIENTGNCWIWKNSKINGQYARFYYKGKTKIAHRISYELFKGEIPIGLQIDHLCRNRLCMNPEHLEAVTPRENTLRGNTIQAKNSKKTHCIRGHELSKDNLTLWEQKFGRRRCKKCVHVRAKSKESG